MTRTRQLDYLALLLTIGSAALVGVAAGVAPTNSARVDGAHHAVKETELLLGFALVFLVIATLLSITTGMLRAIRYKTSEDDETRGMYKMISVLALTGAIGVVGGSLDLLRAHGHGHNGSNEALVNDLQDPDLHQLFAWMLGLICVSGGMMVFALWANSHEDEEQETFEKRSNPGFEDLDPSDPYAYTH